MIEDVIKGLMASLECDVCGECYGIDNIDILGHEEDLWFLMVICPACQTQCLITVVIREGGMPQVITDLTEVELDRFRKVGVLTADEVLDVHNFLKDFDGDFSQLFGQKEGEA